MEKSKTSKCKRLEKLIVTYLHMYKWNCYASRSIPLSEKKNVKTLRNLLNLLHILSCALPICFSRNLLNLSNRCLRHRRRRLRGVSPLAFSFASLCPFLLPSPASPASPTSASWLLCWCSLYLSLVSHLPATCL